MSGGRDKLEQKVSALEQRLALVERFVELRYCETFRDFSIRNKGNKSSQASKDVRETHESDNDDDNDEGGGGSDGEAENQSDEEYSTRRSTRSARGKPSTRKGGATKTKTSTPKSSSSASARMKSCVVKLVKTPDTTAVQGEIGDSPRYGTRRQTKLAEVQVKKEIEDLSEHEQSDSRCGDDYTENDDGGGEDDYFTYPEGTFAGNDDQDDDYVAPDQDENQDMDDADFSPGAEDVDDDDDYEPKREQPPIKLKRGRPKSEGSAKKPKKNIYYLTSIKDLPPDATILSTDPSRGECPICKQHWKLEVLDQHIASHTKERHIKCDHCDKTYFKMDDLRAHVRTQHDREKYYPKCRLCHTPIVRKMILHEKYCVKKALMKGEKVDEKLVESVRKECARKGLEFVLPDETVPPGMDPEEKVPCPECKRLFRRRNFQQHVKSHSLARNWKCTKCSKSYIHKHDLIRHMVVTHEVSLKCNICEKTFETRMDLKNHSLKCRKKKGLLGRPRKIVSSPSGYVARKPHELPYTNLDVSSSQPVDSGDAVLEDDSTPAEPIVVDQSVEVAQENEVVVAGGEEDVQ